MSQTIETGTGEGYLAAVTSDGELKTTTAPAPCSISRSSVTVGNTSGVLVSALTGRRGLWVQNQGANAVYVRFEGAAATNQDWLVAAGGEFRADDFSYEGEIRAIAPAGNSQVLVLQKS